MLMLCTQHTRHHQCALNRAHHLPVNDTYCVFPFAPQGCHIIILLKWLIAGLAYNDWVRF